MKRITIKSMKLTNFKGVRSLEVDFGSLTSIFGRNGTGKTTVMDAFTWVLFDKDGRDTKGFQVATTDKEGNFIPRLTHEVTLVLDVDGREMTLTKKYSDKWVKQRGSTTERFSGWETTYMIDSVPMRKGDYTARVAEICDYDTFKLITIPGYLMTWDNKKRRSFLLEMAGGDLTNEEIAHGDKDLMALVQSLEGRTFDDYNTMINAQLKRLREERDVLEPKIEERTSDIRTDLPTLEEVEKELAEKKEAQSLLVKAIAHKRHDSEAAAKRNKEHLKKINRLDGDLLQKANGFRLEQQRILSELKYDLSRINLQITNTTERIDELKQLSDNLLVKIQECNSKREELLGEFNRVKANTLEISTDDLCCPTCGRLLEGEDLKEKREELIKNFNADKVSKLSDINQRGKENKEAIARYQQQNAEYLGQMTSLREELQQLKAQREDIGNQLASRSTWPQDTATIIANNPNLAKAKEEIEKLKAQEDEAIPEVDVADLMENQMMIVDSIGELNQVLADIRNNENNIQDLEQKKKRFKEIGEKIASLEKQEDAIMRFSHKRVDMLQTKINSMFTMVTFRLFRDQINGGEADIAEPYIDGVPYSTNLNTGKRINAGIDMCNGISKLYGIEAPIFVDNAEAVNELIHSDSQVVRLVVSEDDKLRISTD